MTNNTFHKLLNEIQYNNLNPYFIDLCNKYGVNERDIHAMKDIRKICKKEYLWFEDSLEIDIFLECSTSCCDDVKRLKNIIKEYRQLCKDTSIKLNDCVKVIINKYGTK